MDIFDYRNIFFHTVLLILLLFWQYYVLKLRQILYYKVINLYYTGIMIYLCGVTLNLLGAVKLFDLSSYIWLIRTIYFLGLTTTIFSVIKLLKKQIEVATKIRAELNTDFLTGAGNRKYLNEVWPSVIKSAKLNDSPVTVMLLDLDDFKKLNDHHGHGYGDEVLTKVVANLRTTLGDSEHIIRYGGDEFVIILSGVDGYLAAQISALIKQNLKQMPIPKGENIQVSSGFATYPQDGDKIDVLINLADQRMYHDKTNKNTPEDVSILV